MPSREAKELLFSRIGYEPTEVQAQIHFDNHRIKEVVGGVRAGKSTVGAREILADYGYGDLYWLIGSDYEMAREEFGYLVDGFNKLGVVKNCHFPYRDQCQLFLAPNILIETKSAKYIEKIAAKPVRGILMCEAAQMPYEIFTRSIERLTELDGFLVMTGTLETSLDWYADKYKEFQIPENDAGGISFSLPSWSNTKIFKGRNDPKILAAERILGHDLFMERYGGVPVKPKGLVFPEFKSTLHTGNFPIDPNEPVYVGIDPGWSPSAYAVEFIQFIGDDIIVFDEIYEQFKMTEQIILMVKQKPFFKSIVGGAIDISAKQHQARAPVYDIWRDETGLKLDTKKIAVLDGVNRLRPFFLDPLMHGNVRLHINQTCRGLISELGGCKSPLSIDGGAPRGAWKLKMDSKGTVLSEEPTQGNCDGLKGLIYAAVSRFGLATRRHKASVSSIDIGG